MPYSLFYFVSTAFSALVYTSYKPEARKWLKTINFAQNKYLRKYEKDNRNIEGERHEQDTLAADKQEAAFCRVTRRK